jgi:hypothetical protein
MRSCVIHHHACASAESATECCCDHFTAGNQAPSSLTAAGVAPSASPAGVLPSWSRTPGPHAPVLGRGILRQPLQPIDRLALFGTLLV